MSYSVDSYIEALVGYATDRGLAKEEDRVYLINGLLSKLNKKDFSEPSEVPFGQSLQTILGALTDFAEENGIIPSDSPYMRDLFDTSLMGIVTPRPSEVIDRFSGLYRNSPREATDWFYRFCLDCDYIREYRIVKDIKWIHRSEYGNIEITINLSKPEKDPKVIAALRNSGRTSYPACALCHENEGFAGSLSQAARQTLRQIPLTLGGSSWYLQYSPYSYYNEHCIVLSGKHSPMKIDRGLMEKALDFVGLFPHYFVGSNADIPIVGGSILAHEHMQGGNHRFAMADAQDDYLLSFEGFDDIRASVIHWPMSVIRLRSESKERLLDLSEKILNAWKGYSDPDAFIFAETGGESHNAITPIARRRGDDFELDLVLRNNITTDEYPDGVFHPHKELHNIKKENIGLIEVMGLAVLPSRLKSEMKLVEKAAISGDRIPDDSPAAKHREWLASFADKYTFTEENVSDIIRREIGKTFVKVLEDAGVYKCTEDGRRAFLLFTSSLGAKVIY